MRLLRLLPIFIGFILLLHSCAANKDWANRILWDEYQFDHLPTQEDYPDAGAIILLDEGKMETFGNNKTGFSVFKKHRIVKILNNRGRRFSNVAISYTPNSKIEHLEARTISSDGDITVLDKDRLYDVNLYPNFVFYSDQRAKIFTFPSVEDGSILEYRYEITIENRTLWHSWQFQSNIPTLLSRFKLIKPSEWTLNYEAYGIDLEPEIIENPNGFKSTYIWELKDVPAVKSEFGMPPSRETVAHLALSPVGTETWDDVAKWYHTLTEPQMEIGDEVKSFVSDLTKNAQRKKEKLKLICEWVRDHVRYIAVSIGIGGYQPHPADEVFMNQYGDCKDMTTLMCAMAREVGIDANEAIVSTWQNGLPDTSLPSPFQFNHVIGYFPSVGDSGFWFDATNKGCPFGKLPWYDQGLPVLVVGKKGKAEILTTPSMPPEDNHSVYDWEVNLDSTGAAIVSGETKMWGSYAASLRKDLYYASQDQQQRWLETLLAQKCSGVTLDSFRISNRHPPKDPLVISYTFSSNNFALARKQSLVFKPSSIMSLQLPDYFRSPKRVHPIRFDYGFQTDLKLKIELPKQYKLDTSIVSDTLTSQFGSAFWHWEQSDDVYRVHTSYRLIGEDIAPENYPEFRTFMDDIRERDLNEVVFVRKKK